MEIKPYLRRPQFYETDGMSIIWHGNYVRWMEEARVDYLAQLGWGPILWISSASPTPGRWRRASTSP